MYIHFIIELSLCATFNYSTLYVFFMIHKWQNWLVQRVLTKSRLFINFVFGARIVTGKESTMFIRSDIQMNVKYICPYPEEAQRHRVAHTEMVISAKF